MYILHVVCYKYSSNCYSFSFLILQFLPLGVSILFYTIYPRKPRVGPEVEIYQMYVTIDWKYIPADDFIHNLFAVSLYIACPSKDPRFNPYFVPSFILDLAYHQFVFQYVNSVCIS